MQDQARPSYADLASPIAAVLLACSLVLGGGGSPAPLLELILQGLAALAAAIWIGSNPAPFAQVPAAAWRIAALVAIIPVLHLIPLPTSWWQALPGRSDQIAALELVGAADSWRPLSLSPPRTLASLLVALAALLSLVLVASLDQRARWRVIGVVAAGGVVTLLLGAAQLSGGPTSPLRFFDPEQIFLTGFQANHNSTADLLLVAMLAMAACARHWLDRAGIRLTSLQLAAAVVIADGVMVLGLVMAGSRAGIALLPLVLIFQYLIMQPGARIHWGKAGVSALVAAGLSAAAYFALRDNRAIAAIIGRFDFTGEFRPELWRDSLYALGRFWPVGSGQGTFVPVIMAAERLEVVDPTLPNRAHNDYLEFVLEAGLPGAMVLAVLSVIVLYLAWRALRHPPAGSRTQTLFALGTLAVLGLHSLVDYPLRSMALAAVVATAVGLLIPPRQSEPNSSNKRSQQ